MRFRFQKQAIFIDRRRLDPERKGKREDTDRERERSRDRMLGFENPRFAEEEEEELGGVQTLTGCTWVRVQCSYL